MSSFSLFLGGSHSTFKLVLELSSSIPCENFEVVWTDTDPWDIIKEKLQTQLELFLISNAYEVCILQFIMFQNSPVKTVLEVQTQRPEVRRIHLERVSGTGQCDVRYLYQALPVLPVKTVEHFDSHEGFPFFVPAILPSQEWQSLTRLSLIGCELVAIPGSLGQYTKLKELELSQNKLTTLPPEIGRLRKLEILMVDHNEIVTIPTSLCDCESLTLISLEHNNLNALVLDLQKFPHLQSLLLFGNPLSYIPELSVCHKLYSLSLNRLRVHSDFNYTQFQVTIDGTTSLACGTKLNPLFSVLFTRSSSQHPLLAGALSRLAEFRVNCDAILELPGAPLQQLVLMALSPNTIVQEQAAKVIGLLVNGVKTAEILLKSGVSDAMHSLLSTPRKEAQIYALEALSSLAMASDNISVSLLTPTLIQKLVDLLKTPSSGLESVQNKALMTMGNLSFAVENKAVLLEVPGLKQKLIDLASGDEESTKLRRLLTLRVLAILGEYEEISKILKQPSMDTRGVRILSIDGGGMKGIAAIKMLEKMEQKTGRRIHELFDLIAGTSTGAMLAVALGILNLSLTQCEDIYKKLGYRVFNQAQKDEQNGWTDSLARMYRSGQQGLRVVMAGCKHDASAFEKLLKELCSQATKDSIGGLYIDSAVHGGPRVFAVSTLTSITPAMPFLFRNYEFSVNTERSEQSFGSSKYEIWQGIRASSAAPYYFDDFKLDGLHFQDGATTANNPAALAVKEARLLWPENSIDCLCSIGLGAVPPSHREKSSSSFIENGSVLIESSCSVERVNEVLTTMSAMVPGMNYFRFNPVDKRCELALDGLEPEKWKKLEQATEDYIKKNMHQFCNMVDILMRKNDQQNSEFSQTIPPISVLFLQSKVNGEDSFESVSRSLHYMDYSVGTLVTSSKEILLNPCFKKTTKEYPLSILEAEGFSSLQFLAEALRRRDCGFNAVHFDLEITDDYSAFVLSWKSSLWTILSDSDEARKLAVDLGLSADSSLPDALQRLQKFQYLGSLCELQTRQDIFSDGQTASSVLVLKRRDPDLVLNSEGLSKMKQALNGLVITCSQCISPELVSGLLNSGGARAVIHSNCHLESTSELVCFFKVFYDALAKGYEIESALDLSEKKFVCLKGTILVTYEL
eukprot:g254.t1